jgi:N-acetylneuraminic acid mutarotase
MYIFGGWDNYKAMNCMYCYDFKTSRWTKLHPEGFIPEPRDSHTANLVGSKILIVGGGHVKQRYNQLLEYDISTNRFRKLQWIGEINIGLAGHISAVSNSKLYVFGGGNGMEWLRDVYEYDIPSGKWSVLSYNADDSNDIAPGNYGMSCVMYNSSLIVFGGGDGKLLNAKIYKLLLDVDSTRNISMKTKLILYKQQNLLTDIIIR